MVYAADWFVRVDSANLRFTKKGEQCGQALFPGHSSKSLHLYARSALRESMSLEGDGGILPQDNENEK